MPKVSTVSGGPQTGNRFATGAVVQSMKDVTDQLSLNSTINRIQNIKSKYVGVVSEGKRISGSVHERGRTMASTGAERAQQLRGLVAKSIGNVQRNTSKDVAGKTTLIQATNQPATVEAGKGTNVNFSAG